MKKFEIMTKYIPLIADDSFGEWIIDRENDGTLEHPMHMPFVNYSEMVRAFISDVYEFEENNKDFMLTRYGDILKEHDIEWGQSSMTEADVRLMNGQVVMAMIMGAVRAERFCDGALLAFFKDGTIVKWLQRLYEIDNM